MANLLQCRYCGQRYELAAGIHPRDALYSNHCFECGKVGGNSSPPVILIEPASEMEDFVGWVSRG